MTDWAVERAQHRRIWRRTFWIVGIALIAGAVLGVIPFHPRDHPVLHLAATMLTIGGLAGTFSLLPTLIGRSGETRIPLLGVNRSAARLITRTALGAHGADYLGLSHDERRRALEYATRYSLNQPLLLAHSLLLFVGLPGMQLRTANTPYSFLWWVHMTYLTVTPALLVAGTVLTALRVRRATAYVHQHAAADTTPLIGG